jgi:hypothetical protein
MPWAERDRMSLRQELVHLVATQKVSMTELCQRFQISRKTGYKWVQRFRTEGEAGPGRSVATTASGAFSRAGAHSTVSCGGTAATSSVGGAETAATGENPRPGRGARL